jgi:serine/threonine-protein kinase
MYDHSASCLRRNVIRGCAREETLLQSRTTPISGSYRGMGLVLPADVLCADGYQTRQIGHYLLKRLLGSGGMGEVHLAEHHMLKRPCAIKFIRPDKAGDPLTLARFEREVRTTSMLSHWNTIDIYDYGRTDDGTFYYVMEYLRGMNLNELVQNFGPMPAERVVYLMRQACDALIEAHSLDFVHRDLKPANVFAAVRGGQYDVSKLLDFGLVKPMHNLSGVELTQDGSITGSPLFMSPEQANGDGEPDKRSDIYSLGAMMYFLLTGRPPFVYDKPLKIIIAHACEPPQPISQLVADVPHDLQGIVLRCLEKNPDDRFRDAEHLAQALESSRAAHGWSRFLAARWWTERCFSGSWPTTS